MKDFKSFLSLHMFSEEHNLILEKKDLLLSEITSDNKKAFFERVWSTPQSVYVSRLRKIGLIDRNRVLDYGAGFGQWMLPLSLNNKHVYALEPDPEKMIVLRRVKELFKLKNVVLIDNITSDVFFHLKGTLDALFMYSVLYFLDWRKELPRIVALLESKGLIYINTNDLGWYLYNLFNTHNDSEDYSSREMALNAIYNSIAYNNLQPRNFLSSNYDQVITPQQDLLAMLKDLDVVNIEVGPDGGCGSKTEEKHQFFTDNFKGIPAVYEILGVKN